LTPRIHQLIASWVARQTTEEIWSRNKAAKNARNSKMLYINVYTQSL